MSTFKLTVIDDTILCSELSGELDNSLASRWVDKLEEIGSASGSVTRRFYDVRNVHAVDVNFDDLWSFAQRRINECNGKAEILTAFWASTPLNYGMCRMFQSLTEGTALKIKVFYTLEEIADYLDIDISLLKNINY